MTLAAPTLTALELLRRYEPGAGSLLAGPRRTLLGLGSAATVPPVPRSDPATLAARARATLADAVAASSPPILIGALPFAPDAAPHLVVPAALETAPPLRPWRADGARSVLGARPRVEPLPSPARYLAAVERVLAEVRRGTVEKVVLARALELSGCGEVDVPALLANLAAADPEALAFAVNLPSEAGPRTLVGATPELLVRRRAGEVTALPLAGSARRAPDPVADGRAGAGLLRSEKDRAEHELVVAAVVAGLERHCDLIERPPSPELRRTRGVWHLATPIRARVADPDACSLTLAAGLHPTPAVCGAPTAPARAAIAALEPADRGFYAGAVGWQEPNGDGEWAVAIRCAEVGDDSVRVWAGAGIVAGSDPEAELAETAAKWETVLAALGLEEAR